MPTLSVVMIVKNEGDCLAACLENLRDTADEIVIGDTGSTDDTLAVAQQSGARAFSIGWHNDFSEARNSVLTAASGAWLLHLDADEALDQASAGRVREVVDGDGFGADAIEVTIANYCDTPRAWRWVAANPGDPMARGHAGYIRTELLRLFRNGCGFEYREPVHENITESVHERGGRIRSEPIIIHHYGYDPSSPRSAAKAQLYLDLGREKVRRRPNDPKAWHDLAEQLLVCGDALEAEQNCRKALELDPMHLGAATTLANLLLNRGDLDEARVLLEALERGGVSPPHAQTALAAIACKQGRLDDARRSLEATLAAAPDALMARYYLARTLDRLGDAEGAGNEWEQALAIAPSLKELQDCRDAHRLRLEGERLYQHDKARQALETLVQAMALDSEDPLIHNDLGVVLIGLGEVHRARESFERALRLAPGMPEAEQNLDALEQ